MSAPVDLLVLGCPHPTVITELDCAFDLHRLWEAPEPDRLLAKIAPVVRGLVVDGGSVGDELLSRFPRLEIVASYGGRLRRDRCPGGRSPRCRRHQHPGCPG